MINKLTNNEKLYMVHIYCKYDESHDYAFIKCNYKLDRKEAFNILIKNGYKCLGLDRDYIKDTFIGDVNEITEKDIIDGDN